MKLKDIQKTKGETKFLSCRISKKHYDFIRNNNINVRKMIIKLIEGFKEFK